MLLRKITGRFWFRMGLAKANGGGVLEITEDGKRRLVAEGLRTVNRQG
jgi:hypothetical protein